MNNTNHVWNFSTIGGVKRVNLESGQDLAHISELDPKLWTALSCPVSGLEIDKKTLELIDADKDGQIRVPEIIGAVKWVTSVLKNPGDLLRQDAVFPLSAINDQTEPGRILLNSAKVILKNSGKEDATSLTVEEASDTQKIFAGSRFNGDGIITEDTTADPELIKTINDIIKCTGSASDRGGKQGITLELLQSFMEECQKYAAWYAKKDADLKNIFPLGDNTEAAYRNFIAIKSKVDDYFIRCRLAAFDTQTTDALNLQVTRVEAITAKDLSASLDEIATYPIAKVNANNSLPLVSGINPAWESAITTFNKLTVALLFPGSDSISEKDWNTITDTFAPYALWLSEKEGATVEPLGIERVLQILSGGYKEQLNSLIDEDNAVQTEANNIIEVNKLVRYHRDLFTLLKNFVTFYDFYDPGSKAIFQAGALYIDQRSCDLCIKVRDMPKHNAIASFSGMYLIYCDCTSRATQEKMTIAAALTNGDIDNLSVGKNALFYDRSGLDWDATVIKIIDNPISIRQAFFSPYRKVSRFIEMQVNKMAASGDAKVSADMSKNVENISVKPADEKPKKDAQPPFDIGKFVGIFAAIGLAIGAIGTAIAATLTGFMKLEWWKMPIALLGIVLLISGPSMIIAYLKLRKRNLAPILDANGWAINARVIVNIQFGNTLTHLAELPANAKININDPFTRKKRPVLQMVLILLIIAVVVLFLLWKYKFLHL